MVTYANYFNTLDYELQQQSEGGDNASDDSYRSLPSDQAERVINETIKEYVLLCADRFEQELVVTFKDTPSGDIDEAVSGNEYTAPDQIQKVIAFKEDSAGNWKIPSDSSDLTSTIYSPSNKVLYNGDGWVEDDTITLKVVLFPEETMTDSGNITTRTSDNIPFPDEHIRLLTLTIKKKSLSRKGDSLSDLEINELFTLEKRWVKEKGKIRKKALIAFTGYNLGR
jgi:hypothetical protein